LRTPHYSFSSAGVIAVTLLLAAALLLHGCSRQQPAAGRAAAVPITSGDWPLFRGDARLSGVAAGALPERLALRWSFKAAENIKSSPVIAGGRVFIGAGSSVIALSAAEGRLLWRFKTDGDVEAPPLCLAGGVFVGDADGTLYALDAAHGTRRWAYRTEGKIAGAANSFPAPDGKNLRLIVGSYDTTLHCLDAATGTLLWKYETGNYINGAPAVADGRIVFGGCDAQVHVLNGDGQPQGQVDARAYVAGSIALAGKQGFLGQYGNQVLCVDLAAMTVVWTYGDEKEGAPFFSSPTITADRLVIGGRDGAVHCLRRTDGKRLWLFHTRGDVDSSPVVCGDKVAVGSSDGRLYLLRLADGNLLWSYEIGAPITTSPAIGAGLVVVAADDGTVYAFGAAP